MPEKYLVSVITSELPGWDKRHIPLLRTYRFLINEYKTRSQTFCFKHLFWWKEKNFTTNHPWHYSVLCSAMPVLSMNWFNQWKFFFILEKNDGISYFQYIGKHNTKMQFSLHLTTFIANLEGKNSLSSWLHLRCAAIRCFGSQSLHENTNSLIFIFIWTTLKMKQPL